jgi:hypothetical protein
MIGGASPFDAEHITLSTDERFVKVAVGQEVVYVDPAQLAIVAELLRQACAAWAESNP